MVNTFIELTTQLRQAGMTKDEALLYANLIQAPATHLQLSRVANMNRTKVYRVIADLEEQGLVTRRSDDRGMFLIASDPLFLDEQITKREIETSMQRTALERAKILLPALAADISTNDFAVYTYEGAEGMRQMQWHELQTEGILYAMGYLTYEELIGSRSWAEKFRERVADKGYDTYEIISRLPANYDPHFTESESFLEHYKGRTLSSSVLPIFAPMVMYNDTVAIYQIESERKFGIEIVHAGYAKTMRKMFEQYWAIAEPL